MPSGAYSIRESLQGALHDFIRGSGCQDVDLEELVREFVGLLAAYREEGASLFPQMFVFLSATGLRALVSTGEVTIGHANVSASSAARIVKDCAPLAAEGWSIFVLRENDSIRYGVFRSLAHSVAVPADEAMRDLGFEVPVLLIRNRGHLTVELRSSTGHQFTVALTTTPAMSSTIEAHVSNLIDSATSALSNCANFKAYLGRLVAEVLQYCHGTLIAVIDLAENEQRHNTLTDGVWLEQPVDLAERYRNATTSSSAETLSDLRAAEMLLKGMINSDGIVVFGTNGTILGYRVFLKPRNEEAAGLPETGGGRRRTFELMRLRTPTIFKAALIRSQDGATQCERSENAQ